MKLQTETVHLGLIRTTSNETKTNIEVDLKLMIFRLAKNMLIVSPHFFELIIMVKNKREVLQLFNLHCLSKFSIKIKTAMDYTI
jgi:hypothetical protein